MLLVIIPGQLRGGDLPQTFILSHEVSDWSFAEKNSGNTIGLVPTMGALHAGHLSLIEEMKKHSDRVLVSIFVNPKQFGPREDFSRYPRTLKEDIALLDQVGTDALFVPNNSDIYPEGYQTHIYNASMANDLCGGSRPGHFEGVLTVVAKLFNITFADYAIFGKKDYQQFRIIETMVRDLNFPIHILGGETVRESSGLAMSSRNKYLDDVQRHLASQIYKGLVAARGLYQGGERHRLTLVEMARETICSTDDIEIEYLEIRNQTSLEPCGDNVNHPPVMLVAAHIAGVRLIDNLELDASS